MPITSTTQQQQVLSLASATPGNSAIGDAAAAGTSASVARADHVHGREAAATAGASAVGDTAAAGSATTVARSDHRHSREAFGTPVNIDASVTSLSAGSLTTVARADHVHTVSNTTVLIARQTTSVLTSAVQFDNVPQTYRHLLMMWSARSTTLSGYDLLRAQYALGGGAIDTNARYIVNGAQTYDHVGYMQSSNASYNALYDTTAGGLIYWYNYKDHGGNGIAQQSSNVGYSASTAPGYLNHWTFAGVYYYSGMSGGMTSIKMAVLNGNFAVGSTFSLYGIP